MTAEDSWELWLVRHCMEGEVTGSKPGGVDLADKEVPISEQEFALEGFVFELCMRKLDSESESYSRAVVDSPYSEAGAEWTPEVHRIPGCLAGVARPASSRSMDAPGPKLFCLEWAAVSRWRFERQAVRGTDSAAEVAYPREDGTRA